MPPGPSGEVAALSAALLWTVASGLWRSLSDSATAVQLNTVKNALATVLFLPVLVRIPWQEHPSAVVTLLLSGMVGIAVGDSFYLAALRRIGTRRTLTVEATGPVLASLGSLFMQGEAITAVDFAGAALVATAVLLIARPTRLDPADAQQPLQLRNGLVLAFGAVISGLVGAFLARGVLIQDDFTALDSAAIRLLGGMVLLLPTWWRSGPSPKLMPSPDAGWRVVIATLLGTNLGILLQQMVFQNLAVGPGVTLMSTAPLMALAIARIRGQRLQAFDVAAGALGVSGVALTSL